MYAVIRRYQFDPKSSEEISRHIRESFIPLLRKTPGFAAYHWLDTGAVWGLKQRGTAQHADKLLTGTGFSIN